MADKPPSQMVLVHCGRTSNYFNHKNENDY
jgi:hypothetical protein